MRAFVALLSIAAAAALGGCATSFQDTAPADDGRIYVVGAKQVPFVGMQPTVWRCPAKSPGECEEMTVYD